MKITKSIAAAALAGAVTLSPMLALADTGADVNVKVDANASTSASTTSKHHPFMENIKTHLDAEANAEASTSENHKHSLEQKKAAVKAWVTGKKDDNQKDGQKIQARGQKLVEQRIAVLQNLAARINDMKLLTAEQKTAIVAQINAQITVLTDLKTKISSETSTSTLVADLKSIRPDYRTYLLVLPRTAILAAGNRVLNITDQMTTEGVKLQARITAAKNAGTDVSAAQTAYADYTSKIADAKVQAQAAIDLVKDLKVDQGDAAKLAANTAALKSARAKLEAARTDLKAARTDMRTIMKGLKVKGSEEASTTVESHN